ncbi:MAG: replication-associated recombination protein A, partial [Clostridia bacterium]
SLCKATELAEKYPNAQVPSHLMDTNFSRSSDFKFGEYKYPHNYGGYVEQQYLPNELIDEVIYRPTGNGKDINKKLNERGSNK